MIHIGDIIPKPSDKWADMPEIPKDLDELDKRERKVFGCLYVIIGILMLGVAMCTGFMICSFTH